LGPRKEKSGMANEREPQRERQPHIRKRAPRELENKTNQGGGKNINKGR